MPSTPRAMNVWICSNWRLASLSATASIISMPRRSSSARTASKLATQYSVCSVSKATPIRTAAAFAAAPRPQRQQSHQRTIPSSDVACHVPRGLLTKPEISVRSY